MAFTEATALVVLAGIAFVYLFLQKSNDRLLRIGGKLALMSIGIAIMSADAATETKIVGFFMFLISAIMTLREWLGEQGK